MEKIINRQNVLFNFNIVKNLFKGKKVCAVVKADGYGSGLPIIVKLLKRKADFFAVAAYSEAIEARKYTKKPILILNKTDKNKIAELANLNISFAVSSISEIKTILETKTKAKIHIKINSGMNRLGIKTAAKFKDMLNLITTNKQLKLEGIYTHLYNGKDKQAAVKQIKIFKRIIYNTNLTLKQIEMVHSSIKHVLSTDGLFMNCYEQFDMVRVGLAVYGYGSDSLKPALFVCAEVIAKQKLKVGESAGYSAVFTAKKPAVLAVLNIGYANGVLRNYLGFHVLIKGHFAKIVAVCMNLIIIDITDIKNIRLGSKAVIMGEDKYNNKITAEDIAKYTGTIGYEVLTNFK